MSRENEQMSDHAQVAELEHEEETALQHQGGYKPDYASQETIHEALQWAGLEEYLGYDEETAQELRQMNGSSSYGASDLEEKLPDDSPARAMLAEGYHKVTFENEEGERMLDYPVIQAAVNDIAQAVGNMSHIDNQAQEDAHTRYAVALTHREVNALETALANWSSSGDNADEISQITELIEQITSDHREAIVITLNEIAPHP